MREIKFRAWNIKRGDMMSWDELKEYDYLTDAIESENRILMQYTGLLDKEGKEIYEGDIVKVTFNEDEHECDECCEYPCDFQDESKKTVVTWQEEIGGFMWSEIELFGGEYWYGFNSEPYIYEVIGNTYENPELLK